MNTLRPLASCDEELMRGKENLSLRLNTRIESGRHPLKPGSSGCMQAMQRGSKKATGRLRAASRLTGSDRDIIVVEPMDEGHALRLFTTKIHGEFDDGDARRLLQALDYMPLAISQAAAY